MNNKIDFGGRRELFRALVGSHNYNLNTSESDKDYKVFVMPNFNDLYTSNQFSKGYIGETEDLEVHDCRKLSSLWWKANVNFLEVLFSNEVEIYTINVGLYTQTEELVSRIFDMRNDIAKMNLPYLYDACIGMHITKKKQIDKGTAGTQHLVDKFGFDTKQALHSLRILDFLKRFADNGFSDFKQAIYYNENDEFRTFLLNIKNGIYTKEEYSKISNKLLEDVKIKYEPIYKSQAPNEMTNEELIELIKEIVKINLL